MLADFTVFLAVILSEVEGSIIDSGKHAKVQKELGMIPLVQIVPLTRHSIPPYWAAPSPRGDLLRAR